MLVIDGAKIGKSKQKMAEGIQSLIKALQPVLDDRFALVHTLSVPGRREKIDALLVGPHGALVLGVNANAGRYRCLGDNWYVWDKKANNFWGSEDNPIRDLRQAQRLVESVLSAHGLGSAVPVDGAVVFVNPKLQLEHMEPLVRLIEWSALKEFATQLASTPVYVEKREVERTLGVFGVQASVAHSPRVTATQQQASAHTVDITATLAARGPFGLKRWQLAAMIVMGIVDLLVLCLAVYVFFFMAP